MSQKRINIPVSQYWKLLSTYLGRQKARTFLLSLALLTSIALQLVNPQIVKTFIDSVERGYSVKQMLTTAAIFLSIAVVRQGIILASAYLSENIAWTATNQLRADLALHCMKLDMSFHKQFKPGELIERVDGDVNQLAQFFSQLIVRLTANLLLVTGVLTLLWFIDWRLGLSVSLIALPALWALNWINKRTIPRWNLLRQADADLFGALEEWLTGTEEIRSSGAKPYIMRRLYEYLRRRWLRILAAMRMNVFVVDLPFATFALAYTAAHIFGATLFKEGTITIGGLYLIFYYIDIMKDPLWEILRQIEGLQRTTANISRIAELQQVQPTIIDGSGIDLPDSALTVRFENVSFHYEDDTSTQVLTDVNFMLKPGTVLGLLGHTGSGKTTVTKLMFRFHDPVSGAIRLGSETNQHDIRQAKLSELRQHIAMVTQDVQLFHASVRQNLTMFDDTVSDETITAVIREVGLENWFNALPDGLNTQLAANANDLSAGQAQLLAFARVFLTKPGLIILDEASSRLDPATEQRIEYALDRLLEDRTAIIIAHRLQTVQRADEIMILENGRVLEYGEREKLVNDRSSYFYHLLQTGLEEALV